MNLEMLKASGEEFLCYSSNTYNTIEYSSLLKNEIEISSELSNLGFLVVKNVISKEQILKLRDTYFNLFEYGEYIKQKQEWVHCKNHKDLHGCGNHPSLKFLKTKEFNDLATSIKLKKICNKLLKSNNSVLSPRMIVRSFSRLSKTHTYAHRDQEYFKSSNPSSVMTCWIPIGPADAYHGQLIYLEDSHKIERNISKLINRDKVISKNLNKLAVDLQLRWIRPILTEGDVIFHTLNMVHSSFETKSIVPRLSVDLRFADSKNNLDPAWSYSWSGNDGL